MRRCRPTPAPTLSARLRSARELALSASSFSSASGSVLRGGELRVGDSLSVRGELPKKIASEELLCLSLLDQRQELVLQLRVLDGGGFTYRVGSEGEDVAMEGVEHEMTAHCSFELSLSLAEGGNGFDLRCIALGQATPACVQLPGARAFAMRVCMLQPTRL